MEAPRILELRTDKEIIPETLIVAFGDHQRKRRRVRDDADEFASFADRVPLRYRLLKRGEEAQIPALASILQSPLAEETQRGDTGNLDSKIAASAQRAIFDELVLGLDKFRFVGASVKELNGRIFEVLSLVAAHSEPTPIPDETARLETETGTETEPGQSRNRKRVLQRDAEPYGTVHRYALDVEFHQCQNLSDGLQLEEVKARLRDSFINEAQRMPGIGFVDLGHVAFDQPIAPELLSKRGIQRGTQEGIEADDIDSTFYDRYKDVKADDESDGVGDENESVDYPSSSNEGSNHEIKKMIEVPAQPAGAFFADSDDSDRASLCSSLSSAAPELY